jgi:membrane protein required for colicin V production
MTGLESPALWAHFNWLDWTIVGVIGFSMLISIARGFIREVISLTTWVAAVWISFHYTDNVSALLVGHVASQMMRMIISVGLLFFATLIAGVFVNVVIGGVMSRSRLSVADRFLGVVFGASRGILMVTLMVMVGSMTMIPQTDWWRGANLLPYFEHSAGWLAGFLPQRVVHFVGNEQIVNEQNMRDALSKVKVADGVVDKVAELAASAADAGAKPQASVPQAAGGQGRDGDNSAGKTSG